MIDFGYGVSLHSLKRANNEKYRTWRNDEKVRMWCRQSSLISELDQEEWFERQNFDPTIAMFEICVPGNVVGVCGLTSIDRLNSRAEFSLYIGPEHWCNGYAKAGLLTLFKHGFQDLNLHRIWGESFAGNPAIRLFEKIQMLWEGVRYEHYFKSGRYIDAHLYYLTAGVFEAVHGPKA
jgi:RimJ/RimL family protein N-acetyltransferase